MEKNTQQASQPNQPNQDEQQIAGSATESRLIAVLNPMIEALGYEVVHLETLLQRHKVLRIFIDFTQHVPGRAIGIEDCVKVSRALDEPLEANEEIDSIFKGPYELEVSSPGVDRPLRRGQDFERFRGRDVRIHIFRPLNAQEIGNAGYLEKNPRQKNFVGKLEGLEGSNVLLAMEKGVSGDSGKKGKARKPGKKPGAGKAHTNSVEAEMAGAGGARADLIRIPLPLISKANLEPVFDFDREAEAELDAENAGAGKKASR